MAFKIQIQRLVRDRLYRYNRYYKMRKDRAKKIAETLGNAPKWHSHGRGISMLELQSSDIKLKIDDFGQNSEFSEMVRNYHGLASDYFRKGSINQYIHTKTELKRVG